MRRGFDPWVGKISWRRTWQPTPVFLPGESHRQRNLAGYSLWGCKRVGQDLSTKHVTGWALPTSFGYCFKCVCYIIGSWFGGHRVQPTCAYGSRLPGTADLRAADGHSGYCGAATGHVPGLMPATLQVPRIKSQQSRSCPDPPPGTTHPPAWQAGH